MQFTKFLRLQFNGMKKSLSGEIFRHEEFQNLFMMVKKLLQIF